MQTRENPKDCLEAALRLLAGRDHSCAELFRKLIHRGFPEDQVKRAIDECLRLHYLDDARYADGYARQLQRKGYGCRRIQKILIEKGVDDQFIATCLDSCCREENEIQSCLQAMQKKLKSCRRVVESAEGRAKMYRFLLGRGFLPPIIRQVMDKQGSSIRGVS